jgi:imidazoleglycerol-phosphate dehydratase/histidinol-phosphatase
MGRSATLSRKTKETNIEVTVDLDGTGRAQIDTPLPFLTHMVEQIARHGLIDLTVKATGDVEIDGHHTTEDLGLVLGQCVAKALGDKAGLVRYGWATLPMDEARVTCALDLSGRPFFVWEGRFNRERVGELPTELVPHFFRSLAETLGAALHITVRGENAHHMIESCFKGVGRSLRQAIRLEGSELPSTKGTL